MIKGEVANIHQFGEYFIIENSYKTIFLLREEQFKILYFYCRNKNFKKTVDEVIRFYDITENIKVIRENVNSFIKNCIKNSLIYDDFYFTGVYKKYYPRVLNIEMTNFCNFSCSHCYKEAKNSNSIFLSEKILEDLIKNYKGKIATINITGGEPLSYPNINKLLDKLTKNFTVNVTTNGSLIDIVSEENLKWCNDFQISIYGFNQETFSVITNNKIVRFSKILDNISYLKRLNKRITISIVVNNLIINESDKIIKLLSKIKPDSIIVSKCGITGRAIKNINLWQINERDYNLFIEKITSSDIGYLVAIDHDIVKTSEIEDNDNISFLCGAGTLMYSMDENGILYNCLNLHDEIFKIGNLNKIEENSKKLMNNFSKKIELAEKVNKKFELCPIMEEFYEKISKKT